MTLRGSADVGELLLGGRSLGASLTRLTERKSAILQDATPVGLGAPPRYQAARFRAVNSEYLSRADNAALSVDGVSFTINCWFRPEIVSGTIGLVVKGDLASAADCEYALFIEGGVLKARISTTLGITTVAHATALVANTWYMGTLRYDAAGPTLSVLLNAAGEVSGASVLVVDGTGDFNLGANNAGADSHFTGRMQDVALCDGTLLSLADVTWLYNVGVPRHDSTAPAGMSEVWFLDELEGDRAGAAGNTLIDNNTVTHADGDDEQATRLAAQFTAASSEYLSNADAGLIFNSGAGPFTAGAWVYLDSKPSAGTVIIGRNQPTGDNREWALSFNFAADKFRFQCSADGVGQTAVSDDVLGSPSLGTWYYVAGGWDGATIWISTNGGARTTAAFAGPLKNAGASAVLRVGANGNNTAYHDGRMQSVSYWNSSLSTTGVVTAYNYGTPLSYVQLPTSLLSAASLVSYWNLDEASGTRNDSHSTNHLTDNNTVTNAAGKEPAAVGNFQRWTWTGLRSAELETEGLYDDSSSSLLAALGDTSQNSTNRGEYPAAIVLKPGSSFGASMPGVGGRRLLSYSLAPGTATSTDGGTVEGKNQGAGLGAPAGGPFTGWQANIEEYGRYPVMEGLTRERARYGAWGDLRDGTVLWAWGARGETTFAANTTITLDHSSNYTFGPIVDLGASGKHGYFHVHEDRPNSATGLRLQTLIFDAVSASGPYTERALIYSPVSHMPIGRIATVVGATAFERYMRAATIAPANATADWRMFLGFMPT